MQRTLVGALALGLSMFLVGCGGGGNEKPKVTVDKATITVDKGGMKITTDKGTVEMPIPKVTVDKVEVTIPKVELPK